MTAPAPLCLDIGNSRVKLRTRGEAQARQLAHGRSCGGADIRKLLQGLPEAAGRPVWVAQVLGADAEAGLHDALLCAGASQVRFAHTRSTLGGLRIAYSDPERLGVDRFLALLGLWRERQTGFLVASAGTALTLDIVNDDGRHLGGYIAPGLHLMRQAVLDGTRFVHGEAVEPQDHPGTSTEACVAEAALAAALGLLERAAERHPWPAVLSGGDAERLASHLDPERWQMRASTVLDGLECYAQLAD